MLKELSYENVKEIVGGLVRYEGIPDQNLLAKGFYRDAFDASLEVVRNQFADLDDFDIIGYPNWNEAEKEYQLQIYNSDEDTIGYADIIISTEAAKYPVGIKIERIE